jgi:lipopolysaccharide transport system ATP-binding protein
LLGSKLSPWTVFDPMTGHSIEAVGLGKRYVLGESTSRDRLRQMLTPMLPNRLARPENVFWALRDVSFTIQQGEAIGVIGRNGAGKSTLLKLLSRVTKPTEGRASLRGRVATLLEVGTGFHPELTGRDNIFLSGTILGMTTAEVQRKFDEIVAFAEVDKFIDTPVKRYSSGMYVRLAFAVAAFLDPEILIVDEVLAVGDVAFQRKSLGKLNEAADKYGRTVLFVSHNLEAIRTFCHRVLLLENGKLVFDGPVRDGLERYLKSIPAQLDVSGTKLSDRLHRASGAVRFTSVTCLDEGGEANWQVRSGDPLRLRLGFTAIEDASSLVVGVRFRSATSGDIITTIRETVTTSSIAKGTSGELDFAFPHLPLRPGEVSLYLWLARADDHISYDIIDENVDLPFIKVFSDESGRYAREGVVSLDYQFALKTI